MKSGIGLPRHNSRFLMVAVLGLLILTPVWTQEYLDRSVEVTVEDTSLVPLPPPVFELVLPEMDSLVPGSSYEPLSLDPRISTAGEDGLFTVSLPGMFSLLEVDYYAGRPGAWETGLRGRVGENFLGIGFLVSFLGVGLEAGQWESGVPYGFLWWKTDQGSFIGAGLRTTPEGVYAEASGHGQLRLDSWDLQSRGWVHYRTTSLQGRMLSRIMWAAGSGRRLGFSLGLGRSDQLDYGLGIEAEWISPGVWFHAGFRYWIENNSGIWFPLLGVGGRTGAFIWNSDWDFLPVVQENISSPKPFSREFQKTGESRWMTSLRYSNKLWWGLLQGGLVSDNLVDIFPTVPLVEMHLGLEKLEAGFSVRGYPGMWGGEMGYDFSWSKISVAFRKNMWTLSWIKEW